MTGDRPATWLVAGLPGVNTLESPAGRGAFDWYVFGDATGAPLVIAPGVRA
jgi:hypothetical protein